jgi:hypothetical protein
MNHGFNLHAIDGWRSQLVSRLQAQLAAYDGSVNDELNEDAEELLRVLGTQRELMQAPGWGLGAYLERCAAEGRGLRLEVGGLPC